MALGATIYVFKIDLADSDRGVYQPLELRVARHPSETEDHLLTRVLAYCLEYTEGIAFSNGLFDSDQPTIAVRDLTGSLRVWIDVGAPEAARLHRAGPLAPPRGHKKKKATRKRRVCTGRPSSRREWPSIPTRTPCSSRRGLAQNEFIASRQWSSMRWIANGWRASRRALPGEWSSR
jgi:hypothetical protein